MPDKKNKKFSNKKKAAKKISTKLPNTLRNLTAKELVSLTHTKSTNDVLSIYDSDYPADTILTSKLPSNIDLSNISKQATSIRFISIELLFGYYNYEIDFEDKESSLSILYGDNGAGKTTILSLIFSLLSPISNRGDKTFVAQTPFKKILIEFDNGIQVYALKLQDDLLGGFNVSIFYNDDCLFDLNVVSNNENIIRGEYNPLLGELENVLKIIGVKLYYLSDDRRVRTTFPSSLDLSTTEQRVDRYDVLRHSRAFSDEMYEEKTHHLDIRPVLKNVTDWIQKNTIDASNSGEESANSVYVNVVDTLASKPLGSKKISETVVSKFEKTLKLLEQRSDNFTLYGFATPFPSNKFIELLRKSEGVNRATIMTVLNLRVEGIQARLDALESIKNIVSTFIETINEFLHDKKITFNLLKGLLIIGRGNIEIAPNKLSSGEKQLLLILSNTLLARDKATIFIIDEPELSLNVKWQRILSDALIKCSEGSQIQYIMASHSIELITGCRKQVRKLVEIDNGK